MRDCLSTINNLDESAVYNIARDEKLLLTHFTSKKELEEWAKSYQEDTYTFEIIAKMQV
jgi:hypothetical protein